MNNTHRLKKNNMKIESDEEVIPEDKPNS